MARSDGSHDATKNSAIEHVRVQARIMTGIYPRARRGYPDGMPPSAIPRPVTTADKPPPQLRGIPVSFRMFVWLLAILGSISFVKVGILYNQQLCRDRSLRELERIGAYVPRGITHLVGWIDRCLPDKFARLFYQEEWQVYFQPAFPPLENGITDSEMTCFDGLTCVTDVVLARNHQVTDAGITHLRSSTEMHTLRLDGTNVTDIGLSYLSGLSHLETLSLNSVPVSDAGIDRLKTLLSLKELYLYGTKVTDDGVGRLKKAIPGAEIHTDWKVYE